MGLMKKFINPNIVPTTRNICHISVILIPTILLCPGIISKLTPGTKREARKIPNVPTIICRIKLNNIIPVYSIPPQVSRVIDKEGDFCYH